MTLHADGNVSETNTGLHPNSAIVPDFPYNASDGFGTWRRNGLQNVEFKIVKMVFDPTHVHIGYLVVDGTARVGGDRFQNLTSDVNILLGTDLDNPQGGAVGGSYSR